MEVSEEIWKFYEIVVKLIEKDYKIANNFTEQVATNMLLGKEFGGTDLNSDKSYEISFIWNLLYNEKESSQSTNDVLSTFSTINSYFNSLLIDYPNLSRQLLLTQRIKKELEENNPKSLTIDLLKKKKTYLRECYN